MNRNATDADVDKAVWYSAAFPLVFIIVFALVAGKLAGHVLDRPQAFTPDEGKTISYFMFPSEKNEPMKTFPGEKKYEELKKGEYDIVHIAPNEETAETLQEESKKYK